MTGLVGAGGGTCSLALLAAVGVHAVKCLIGAGMHGTAEAADIALDAWDRRKANILAKGLRGPMWLGKGHGDTP